MPKLSWNQHYDDQLRQLYPTMGPAKTAALMGRTENSIESRAHRLGLYMVKFFKNPARPELDNKILNAAATDEGFTVLSIERELRHLASQIIADLVKDGKLFRGKLSHKKVRYFTRPEAAEAYVQRNRPADARRGGRYVPIWKQGSAKWDAATPVVYPTNPDGTPAYKHYVHPPMGRVLHTHTYGEH